MTVNDMADLIYIYDATKELQDIANASNIAFSYCKGILGELSRVTNVIAHNSLLYDEQQDFENQRLGLVLNDSHMLAEERAKILFCVEG